MSIFYRIKYQWSRGKQYRYLYREERWREKGKMMSRSVSLGRAGGDEKAEEKDKGWQRPTLSEALQQSREVSRSKWAQELGRKRSPDEIAREQQERVALREFTQSLERSRAPSAVQKAEARHMGLREQVHQQDATYNAILSEEQERVAAANAAWLAERAQPASVPSLMAQDAAACSQPEPSAQPDAPHAEPSSDHE